ncbi:hypothetical protein [Acuticoccus sediminis]|uniref:hypothetical protein n=1 Tax=Acuticoccus sediminis TaxID=2184697 RepID=UPI001CFEB758|nr:hypothetical protein [Acuticoccus sediminis]
MINIQQAGDAESPVLRIIQAGDGAPFVEGPGRVFIYHIGIKTNGEIAKLVRAHDKGGTIVLDRSTEAFAVMPQTTTDLLEALPKGCRIVVLCQNHDYVRAVRALGDERLTAIFMHSFVRTLYNTQRRTRLDDLIARRRPDASPGKLFTCLLNRPRTPKIVVFGWLKANGYLEAGNVSFRGDPAARDGGRLDEMIAMARFQFPSFAAEIDTALSAEWPYVNFEELEKESFIYSVAIPAYDTPVSLVVETEMAQNFERYTEKSLKVLMAGHRAVIAGNAGVVGLLEDLGFTLPGFGTTYDSITDQDVRLRMALAEFDRYMKMTGAERRDFVEGTWEVCLENMRAFTERASAVMARSFRELAAACERSRWSSPPEAAVPEPSAWLRASRSAA